MQGMRSLWPMMKPASAAAAITYYQPYFVNSALNSNAASYSQAWPSFHQTDDIGLLYVTTVNQALTTPTGFTAINTPTGTGTTTLGGGIRLYAFWARATSSSMSAVTIPDSGTYQGSVMNIIRGLDSTANPVIAQATDLVSTASSSFTIPAVTTTTPNQYVAFALGGSTQVVPLTGPTSSGMSEFRALGRLSVSGAAIIASGGYRATAGATNTATGTLTSTSLQERLAIAFKPQPATTAATVTMAGSYSVTDTETGTSASATLIFETTTGLILTGDFGYREQWISNIRAASLYEVRATQISGNTVTGTLNTWLNMATQRTWSVDASYPVSGTNSKSAVIKFEIRDAATTTVLATSANMTFSADSVFDTGL
jgi:hypothetical protein